MTKSDQEEPGGRFDFMWPIDPEYLHEIAAALKADTKGPTVRVTVELSPQAAAVLMLTGKGWMRRLRRIEAFAWGRPPRPWTDADILPFEVARRAESAATEQAERWKKNPWVAMMRVASGDDDEGDE